MPGDRQGRPDVMCVGETMVMLTPVEPAPLVDRPRLTMEVGGAESNVACGMAQLGHHAAWLSRLGADPFGQIILRTLTVHGVDVGDVEIDPARPTGLYLKDPGIERSTVHYYRKGSAAAAMGPAFAEVIRGRGARLVHLSGITPVLSPGCAALVERLLSGPRAPGGPLLSFDVNYRPALWEPARAGATLLPLARRADVVFAGRDEAETLWGAAAPDDIRALLPDVPCLVVKDAEHGATCYEGDERTFVPALRIDVVEPVGAGDAFAAGFLSGLLAGRPARDRLRLGHITAAAALCCMGDLAAFPPAATRDRLLAAADEVWPSLSLSAAPAAAD
ncbi:MAG TPA: sugar kinase [Streptosporangiaceae bacterium]|nr:sugar kinase [Streptosporangiaceae bacterium]